jgi:hypothetical protein
MARKLKFESFKLKDSVSYEYKAWQIISINKQEKLMFLRNDVDHDTRWVRWENIQVLLPF